MKPTLRVRDWITIVEAAKPDLRPDLLPMCELTLERLKTLPQNGILTRHYETCLLIQYGNGNLTHYADAFNEAALNRPREMMLPENPLDSLCAFDYPREVDYFEARDYLTPYSDEFSINEKCFILFLALTVSAFIMSAIASGLGII